MQFRLLYDAFDWSMRVLGQDWPKWWRSPNMASYLYGSQTVAHRTSSEKHLYQRSGEHTAREVWPSWMRRLSQFRNMLTNGQGLQVDTRFFFIYAALQLPIITPPKSNKSCHRRFYWDPTDNMCVSGVHRHDKWWIIKSASRIVIRISAIIVCVFRLKHPHGNCGSAWPNPLL